MGRGGTLLAALLLVPGLALAARDLVSIPVVDHFPLHVDRSTVKREGKVVSFSYVLAVPKGIGKDSQDGWDSTEVEAVIDCKAETYTLGKVLVYTEPLGQGPVQRSVPAPDVVRKYDIVPRSTAGYLADFLCP